MAQQFLLASATICLLSPITPISALNRRFLPYSPTLLHGLRRLASPSDRAVWLRLSPTQELFAAHPADTVVAPHALHQPTENQRQAAESQLTATLQALLARLPADPGGDLPFRGGLLGYSSYDARALPNSTLPAVYFGLYPQFVVVDHSAKIAELVSVGDFPTVSADWEVLLAKAEHAGVFKGQVPPAAFQLTAPFSALTTADQYHADVARIQAYLKAGDCYQVNYAQAFRAQCQGNAALAMEKLLAVSQPAHAAWLRLPEGEILSLSPELFLSVQHKTILAKPIKGTAPRLADAAADAAQALALQNSPKNRAENVMIVDLLRHDISRHAATGSVKVPALFALESLPQVHHLVSHVTGQLAEGSSTLDLLRDCFPGGSITGAPKKRAMEIIAELEPTPRSIYCGSIGFINANGDARFNIAIRTLLRQGDALYAWAGGGIVMDSVAEQEYQECFDKMGALMRALEGM